MSFWQRTKIENSGGTVIDPATSTQIGEVQATPTANTVLGRLKDLLTGIVLAAGNAIIGKVGIDQTTPGTTNNVSVQGLVSDTDYRTPRIDLATHTLQTIGYEHHEIHGGSHFFVCSYQDQAINNVLQFTFLTPNTTKWIHFVWEIDVESETLWEIYEGGTITTPLANAVTIRNNDRNSANTSGVTARYELHANLAAANAAITVAAANILENGIAGSGKGGLGSSKRENEVIFKQNQLYVFRATANAAGYINFCMNWYEHTNKS